MYLCWFYNRGSLFLSSRLFPPPVPLFPVTGMASLYLLTRLSFPSFLLFISTSAFLLIPYGNFLFSFLSALFRHCVSFLTLPSPGKLHCPEPRRLCCCCLLWLLPSHAASWLHKLIPHFTLIHSSCLVSFSTPGVGVERWLYWKGKAEAQSHLCCEGQLATFPGFPCSSPIDTSGPQILPFPLSSEVRVWLKVGSITILKYFLVLNISGSKHLHHRVEPLLLFDVLKNVSTKKIVYPK